VCANAMQCEQSTWFHCTAVLHSVATGRLCHRMPSLAARQHACASSTLQVLCKARPLTARAKLQSNFIITCRCHACLQGLSSDVAGKT
jgi:hypothetical protein